MADNLEARVMRTLQAITAPKTTQDSADKLAAELAISTFIRQHADARYEKAKARVISEFTDTIDGIRRRASDDMIKYTAYIDGADWKIEAAAAKPQIRVSTDDLRTELVKLGVDIKLIDRAIKKVEKKSQPALTLKCHPNAGATGK